MQESLLSLQDGCICRMLYMCEGEGEMGRWLDRQLPVRFKGSRWCLPRPPECCLAPGDSLLHSVWALLFTPVTNTTLLLALKGSLQNRTGPSLETWRLRLDSVVVLKLHASYLSLMKKIFAFGDSFVFWQLYDNTAWQRILFSSQNKYNCESMVGEITNIEITDNGHNHLYGDFYN